MSLLRRVRAEWSGALRSMRYDMGRRPVEPSSHGPDVTSTGMNTFGGLATEEPAVAPKAGVRRRAALVTALGVLTVVGAAGAYLGVVRGLGSVLNASQAEAGTVPSDTTHSPNSGIGRGPTKTENPINPSRLAPAPTGTPTEAAPGLAGRAATENTSAPMTGNITNASPLRTKNPTKGECVCSAPPIPTPTAPATPDHGGPSASPSPSDSAAPSPSETSATPGESATPSDSPQARHRRPWHQ
jgi:hypothetical protein